MKPSWPKHNAQLAAQAGVAALTAPFNPLDETCSVCGWNHGYHEEENIVGERSHCPAKAGFTAGYTASYFAGSGRFNPDQKGIPEKSSEESWWESL